MSRRCKSIFWKIIIVVLVILISVGCGCAKKPELKAIALDYLNSDDVSFEYLPDGSTNLIVGKNKSFNIFIGFTPENALDKKIVCYSDNLNIAEIVDKEIRTKEEGTANIYCENPKTKIKSNTLSILVR